MLFKEIPEWLATVVVIGALVLLVVTFYFVSSNPLS